jgi:hypothetical protein
MTKSILIIAALVLVLHGLVHLMGTAAYMKITEVQGLPYKTTLLAGRWELGERGIALYGLLWAVAAFGFIVAALAFWSGWGWWSVGLVGVTIFSLLLTALDWQVAYAGVVINLVILALVWLRPLLMRAL